MAAGSSEPPGHLPMPAGPYEAVPLRVALPAAGACEVTLAHWYVQRFRPGAAASVVIPFRLHRASGTVSLLGPRGDEMAVEGLVCGEEARLQTHGARPGFRALAMAGGGDLSCTSAASGSRCGPWRPHGFMSGRP